VPEIALAAEGFALDIIDDGAERVAVLRAEGKLGLQYAVYALAEHFLGVRFVHPLFDLAPEVPPAPSELHLDETPAMGLRILYEAAHTLPDLRGTGILREGTQGHTHTTATSGPGGGRIGSAIMSACGTS